MRTTRLAPSPTGDLHLGNLRTFLLTWLMARAFGWRLVLRLEDLDAPRVRPGAAEATLELLAWLGIDHDGPALRQSDDLAPYRAAMEALAVRGACYECALSRAEVRRAASAPHAGERDQHFPAALRPADRARWRFAGHATNHRFATPPATVTVDDGIAGRHAFTPADEVGDFVIWTKQGVPSYQLAVVVDDARQGVTDVVRGDDLLPSAARQALLHGMLGTPTPRWWHVPLVQDEGGERLAKRRESAGGQWLRGEGVPAERVLGLLGWWLDLLETRRPAPLPELLASFAARAGPTTLDRSGSVTLEMRAVRFTAEDLQWLTGR